MPVVLTLVGVAFLLIAVVGVAAHHLDSRRQVVLVAAALAPYLRVAALPGTVLVVVAAVLDPSVWSFLVAVAGVVVAGVVVAGVVVGQPAALTQRRRYRHRRRRRPTPPAADVGRELVVVHANVLLGGADTAHLAAQVLTSGADVLAVVELSQVTVDGLRAAGLERTLPHHHLSPGDGGQGTGIWSRYPLSAMVGHDGFICALLSAAVAVPLVGPVTVVAAHPVPPWPRRPGAWLREMDRLRAVLDNLPEGPVIVAGDFNATHDHVRFRRLTSGRFVDAATALGVAPIRTYAADRWYPPIIAIDHVLLADAAPISVGPVDVRGSDHRGLVIRVLL